MRETDLGEDLFTWSRSRRQLSDWGSQLPSSLCILLILTLFVTAAGLGVIEEIGTKSFNCCGMRINTSKCWTNLSCACDECVSRMQRDVANLSSNYYRLEFCSLFPLNEVLNGELLQNRTFCQEQLKTLQEADIRARASYRSFEGILERIDCGENWNVHTYSATSTCLDCMEAYKNWICFTEVSDAILHTKNKRRPCPSLCESVMQKCPYLLPAVPSEEDVDTLVQIGDSAFNCVGKEDWKQVYMDPNDCLNIDPMEKCQPNNNFTSTVQPTVMTQVPTSNLTTNSTNNGNR